MSNRVEKKVWFRKASLPTPLKESIQIDSFFLHSLSSLPPSLPSSSLLRQGLNRSLCLEENLLFLQGVSVCVSIIHIFSFTLGPVSTNKQDNVTNWLIHNFTAAFIYWMRRMLCNVMQVPFLSFFDEYIVLCKRHAIKINVLTDIHDHFCWWFLVVIQEHITFNSCRWSMPTHLTLLE